MVELSCGPGVVAPAFRSGGTCAAPIRQTKEDLRAIEQKRPDVALARDVWINRRQHFTRNMLTRQLAFIDETSLKTNMAKTTGWAPCWARLVDHAPFGHWQTQPVIAALRHDRLDAH